MHKEWANYGFTDEMSIKVGGMHGASSVFGGQKLSAERMTVLGPQRNKDRL